MTTEHAMAEAPTQKIAIDCANRINAPRILPKWTKTIEQT